MSREAVVALQSGGNSARNRPVALTAIARAQRYFPGPPPAGNAPAATTLQLELRKMG
jgi:hypothetical protein